MTWVPLLALQEKQTRMCIHKQYRIISQLHFPEVGCNNVQCNQLISGLSSQSLHQIWCLTLASDETSWLMWWEIESMCSWTILTEFKFWPCYTYLYIVCKLLHLSAYLCLILLFWKMGIMWLLLRLSRLRQMKHWEKRLAHNKNPNVSQWLLLLCDFRWQCGSCPLDVQLKNA
jgi:hypothetical protein